jgi:hypothetical protein
MSQWRCYILFARDKARYAAAASYGMTPNRFKALVDKWCDVHEGVEVLVSDWEEHLEKKINKVSTQITTARRVK